jgi:hypothetical protein
MGQRSEIPLWLRAALAVAAAIGVAAAVMRAALRRRRGAAIGGESRRHVSCVCGQEYVVAGTDRHRVYWLAGAEARNSPAPRPGTLRSRAGRPRTHL